MIDDPTAQQSLAATHVTSFAVVGLGTTCHETAAAEAEAAGAKPRITNMLVAVTSRAHPRHAFAMGRSIGPMFTPSSHEYIQMA
jgi:hypothetical protein